MRLNIGCGSDFRAGWLNVDIRPLYPESAEFACCDVAELDPWLPDESAEEIVAQDVLEFIPWRRLDSVLVTLWKKLRPGGALFVQAPDAEAFLAGYMDGQVSHEEVQRLLLGEQRCYGDTQQSLWSKTELAARLEFAGLDIERVERRAARVRAWARRPRRTAAAIALSPGASAQPLTLGAT